MAPAHVAARAKGPPGACRAFWIADAKKCEPKGLQKPTEPFGWPTMIRSNPQVPEKAQRMVWTAGPGLRPPPAKQSPHTPAALLEKPQPSPKPACPASRQPSCSLITENRNHHTRTGAALQNRRKMNPPSEVGSQNSIYLKLPA